MSGAIAEMLSDALLQHSSGMATSLLDRLLPTDTHPAAEAATHALATQLPMHETFLIVPAGSEHTPLDLHIDNCHRRCVALYDTQRILQFGG